MSGITFAAWLVGAICADILSLIPYIGLIFSWPFAAFFWLYKIFTGQNFSAYLVTGADFALEGVFSTIPANTLDVIATYFISKESEKSGAQ